MKLVVAILLLVSLILSSSLLQSCAAYTAPAPSSVDCGQKCATRCAKAGVKDRCLNYCGICCQKCQCVPSGTYGNKSECPCYQDMLNNKGKPKCP
ncbi:Gibberellin regulated protein [Dillenia turbinata]|uniref:Gibberellin regulated protein n=1 Tax=Dillenia turbinata TaxID=194707 RepID=A0AAN8VA50_9MAGN